MELYTTVGKRPLLAYNSKIKIKNVTFDAKFQVG